ncbi:DMT family transporter [Pantoea sp. Tr-811]|uniref:DMT family transporter n=1 Tax=Pantoea sp. Tr-811 TaxID=2608361 RepID=UPI001423B5BB|nr:DMT family transporter [Pantoea sp. Tr-811]NIF24888.1 DMT family transporter [Pantoea sp. Tr-811]
MQARKPVDGLAVAIMVALCLTWGAQQVAMKAVAEDVPLTVQVALRSGVAALLVWLLGRWGSRTPWIDGLWCRSGLVVGCLFGAEFLFIAQGLHWTSASHMAVFLYTAPLFAAIGLHVRLPEERLQARQWFGVGLAFAGIAVAFWGPSSPGYGATGLWGDALGLCAGAAWGLTTVAVRTSRLSEAPATQTLFYQLAGGCVLLLVVALATGQTRASFTATATASLVFQTLVVSFASYLIWFWLLRRYLAARLGVMAFMTPVFGVLMGVAVLGESISQSFILGAALSLAGLVMVNLKGGRRVAGQPLADS